MNTATSVLMKPVAPAAVQTNPFPGLRPFREDEEYLFFGRENQVDAMVDKLASTRFLAVVGTSGSGKSSLVNCGLRPALHGGLMARAGTAWRMAQFRPGSDPIRAMARALAEDGVLFRDYQVGGLTLAEIVDTTLRMSKLGLIDIYEQANLSEDVNLLVVVDQFEELFRYRQLGAGRQENVYSVSEAAAAFVNLLLEAKAQRTYPIYVVLTMRSDFLGDCTQFPGLAEAINAGQYLVPRMTRDERRAAISRPVGVGRAAISPVLLTRLVNDVGDNPDQLSILQHALNRTWARWENEGGGKGPLDLVHYEAIGTMAHALDQHAEKAYAELGSTRQQQICEKLFKALTDKATDPRGVRRPTTLGTLCALADATEVEVAEVIDVFREPSRSFLMPPAGEPLDPETVIDISHESLMRVWQRLNTWADEEARSAQMYRRLAETAELHAAGQASLWRDPDLQVALDWRERNQPNETWAVQYHPNFGRAMRFLQESKAARDEQIAAERRRVRRWRCAAAGTMIVIALVAVLFFHLYQEADEQKNAAEKSEAKAVAASIEATKQKEVAEKSAVIAKEARGEAEQKTRDAVTERKRAEAQRLMAELAKQVALSRQVAAQALNHLGEERLDSALLLALESRNVMTSASATTDANSFDARSSLLTALEHGAVPIVSYLRGGDRVAFSPDGKTLASVDAGKIIIWDVATRKPIGRPLAGHGDAVFSIAFSPDGKLLASSSRSDKNLILWNLGTRDADGEPITAHGGSSATLAFSPDGKTLATGGGDKTVLFWDMRTRRPLGEPLSGHTSNVESLAFSRDGKTLASGSWDGTVILWDADTHAQLGPPLSVEASFGQVESVAFSPDSRYLASGGGGGIVLWDVATRKLVGSRMIHAGGVKSVAFSPNGRLLASGSGATVGTVILWNVETREPLRQPLRGHMRWLYSVAFSPDGKTLASSGGDDTIILWDLASLHRLGTVIPGYEGPTDSVAFSRDGAVMASGICVETETTSRQWKRCLQGGIRLWNRASGNELRTLRTGHPNTPTSLVFPSNAGTLVSSSCAETDDGNRCRGIEVQSWSIGTGQFEKYPIDDRRPRLDSMALSPDGKIVAAGSCKSAGSTCDAGEIRLFNVQTGQQIGAPLMGHRSDVDGLAFSPDGQTLVSSTLNDVIFWNVSTGKPRGRPYPGSSTAFTMDGKISAVSAPPVSPPPRTITLRDTSTSQKIGELTIGDHEVVLRMAFSPDGKLLAVSNVNVDARTVTLWDVVRGERLGQPLRWQGGRAFALAFSPDGGTLLAGIEDRGLVSWDVNHESWRRRACDIANRNLSYAEWTQILGKEPYRATCPKLPIDPDIFEAGRRRARAGDIEGAITIFKRARELTPALKLDPRKEAIKSSVEELVANGRYLAVSGDVEGATSSLERAKKLDPGLPLNPWTEARQLAAPGLIAAAVQLAEQGKIPESVATLARAQKFDPALEVPGGVWNTLCWTGSLQRHAAEVMDACDKAVSVEPKNGRFRTSRGLAKAMVQKVDESISDFEAFLAWEVTQHGARRMSLSRREWLRVQRLRHEEWLAALRGGRNPFTPEELKKLLDDKPEE